jgi:tRNA threonylcarbamoyladenosine biosynthesis protein TsaB
VRILAIETSGKAGSVALLDAGRLLADCPLPPEQGRTLAPAVHALLQRAGWTPRDVEVVAVAVGPGSFTGLRVGVTTAKVFAYAVGARTVGIGTLAAIAAQAPAAGRVWSVLGALRGELFIAAFRPADDALEAVFAPSLLSEADWLARLEPGDTVTGQGVAATPPETWAPRAATVGELAWRRSSQGSFDDVWTLAPTYLRRSAAEEKFGPA